jgi:hypothetical protein
MNKNISLPTNSKGVNFDKSPSRNSLITTPGELSSRSKQVTEKTLTDRSNGTITTNLDFKIGSGGVAQMEEEMLKIPLPNELDLNKDLNAAPRATKALENILKTKPDWSRYNATQPDWFAFQTEVKQMVIAILDPPMRQIYEN